MTGPKVVRRIGDHAGPDRVEFDVAITAQQVSLILHRARLVASIAPRAGAPVAIVDIAHIAPAQGLHWCGGGTGADWSAAGARGPSSAHKRVSQCPVPATVCVGPASNARG